MTWSDGFPQFDRQSHLLQFSFCVVIPTHFDGTITGKILLWMTPSHEVLVCLGMNKYFACKPFSCFGHSVSITTFPCSVQMRIYSNLTVIRSMGTIKIITWYAFNNATWESVLVRILQYFYCVLITMPVTTSNYHSLLSIRSGPVRMIIRSMET